MTRVQGTILRAGSRTFARARREPAAFQSARLLEIIVANADTAFGRAHHFDQIHSWHDFRRHVPVVTYDEMEPWLLRAAAGEAAVLTREPVRAFERSSGSTGGNKLLPLTAGYAAELSVPMRAWMHDLFTTYPRLHGTRSYWALSPVARSAEVTEGGIPVGLQDDTAYFAPWLRWFLRQMQAVPASVATAPDVASWRRQTAEHLVAAEDLGLISVWSPTFLTLLMEEITAHLDAILNGLSPAHRRRLEKRIDEAGGVTGEGLWPRLQVVSCWADGPSAQLAENLRACFPSTPIQPKGLVATEGVVTIPLTACEGGVLALGGHLLELRDLEAPEQPIIEATEARPGGTYSPILTTAAGLYRYDLRDAMRCLGTHDGTPTFRFQGKVDHGCDLCGEKLSEHLVATALEETYREIDRRPEFAVLAPIRTPRLGYVIYVDGELSPDELDQLARGIDERLCRSYHYRYCRDLGQLAAVVPRRVRGGWQHFQALRLATGARLGDIKATALHPHELDMENLTEVAP